MKTPSKSPILAAAAAFLISSGVLAKLPHKAEDKRIPAVPAEVMEKGGDAVLDWMLDSGYLTPEYLRRFIGEKAHAATQEGSEGADRNPLLDKLRSGYESLPATAFKVGVKPTWETVAAKLTPDVLAKANKLESPRIYGVNDSGELLIGDGGSEVPEFTLSQNYSQVRNAFKSQGLSLWREDEYRAFNGGAMEIERTWTWLESGDAPALATIAAGYGDVGVYRVNPENSYVYLGARRVLRVKL